jgi:lipopolysaccharide/colanic/teichoic acid biosynthesis glycosyltransferase
LPVVICILPPVCVLIWLLQKAQSPGPLFYVQERAGIQNRTFRIIKFRTMNVGNNDKPALQATVHDTRIFPSGRWMRKFSLDELPQFWNVLRGQMSVVGPRPHLRVHNEQFSHVLSNYQIRSLVKPGITGLAQVRGFRGEALDQGLLRKRIESDLYYIENWSFAADLIIIARTAWHMIFPPKTAY